MYFPPSFLDEIRSRLKPSEVVGRSVALKRRGNAFTGLCPFHKEKTPSFSVSDEKGFYHCFGCGAHGDVIRFTMETSGMSFVEVVENLATQVGLPLPKITKKESFEVKKSLSLYEVMEDACRWFESQLQTTRAEGARDYLKSRKLTNKEIEKFRIGFAPNDRDSLKRYLNEKGILDKDLNEAGIVIKNDRGNVYDRFRGRVIFPIIDIKNRVIAFGGRVLDDSQPKYLNSPETPLFKKRNVLYNENNARTVAFKTGKIVVTEGYMDVIAMDKAGIKNVVAPLGTALTENHIRRLWTMAKEPVICLDGDLAGKRAMQKTADISLPVLHAGHSLRFAQLPGGMDPDDLIQKSGVSQMRKILNNAKNLSDVLWNIELNRHKLETPEQRSDLKKRLDGLASKIKDGILSVDYKKYFDSKRNSKIWELDRFANKKKAQTANRTNLAKSSDGLAELQKYDAVALMLVVKSFFLLKNPEVENDLENIEFSDINLDKLYSIIIEFKLQNEELKDGALEQHLAKEGFNSYIEELEDNHLFIGVVGCPDEELLERWYYNLKLHNLSCLKKEYQNEMLSEEEFEQRKEELRIQMSFVEEEIKRMDNSFGDKQG